MLCMFFVVPKKKACIAGFLKILFCVEEEKYKTTLNFVPKVITRFNGKVLSFFGHQNDFHVDEFHDKQLPKNCEIPTLMTHNNFAKREVKTNKRTYRGVQFHSCSYRIAGILSVVFRLLRLRSFSRSLQNMISTHNASRVSHHSRLS